MSEVMSLEELREFTLLNFVHKNMPRIIASFDAAIRERDELRSARSEMRELARDYERDRDKAEAELAALRKRITDVPKGVLTHGVATGNWYVREEYGSPANLPSGMDDSRVLLVKVDD